MFATKLSVNKITLNLFIRSVKYETTQKSAMSKILYRAFTSKGLGSLRKYHQSGINQIALLTVKEHEDFVAEFQNIQDDLANLEGYENMVETKEWTRRLVDYNLPHGKFIRPSLLIKMTKEIQKNVKGKHSLPNLNRIAWTLDLLNAFSFLMDDIMDGSETRRNRPCWHLVDNIGLSGINDGLLLECICITLLRNSLKGYYLLKEEIMDLFHDVCLKSIHGQTLDLIISRQKDYSKFTGETYLKIVTYKNCYYSFYLPIAVSLLLNEVQDPNIFKAVEKISIDLGMLFSIKDDFMDCFSDPSVSGKVGTDIQDGKCSWLAVTTLERANPEQKNNFLENYGQNDPSKITLIKDIYKEVDIPTVYKKVEETKFRDLMDEIKALPEIIPKYPLLRMAEFLLQRTA